MRQNHEGFIGTPELKTGNETAVEIIPSTKTVQGQNICVQNVSFDVVILRNSSRFDCLILAELVVGKPISFKLILRKEHQAPFLKLFGNDEELVPSFDRISATHFELSYVDNRMIKLRIQETEHSIIF